jgi:hypothetical protein
MRTFHRLLSIPLLAGSLTLPVGAQVTLETLQASSEILAEATATAGSTEASPESAAAAAFSAVAPKPSVPVPEGPRVARPIPVTVPQADLPSPSPWSSPEERGLLLSMLVSVLVLLAAWGLHRSLRGQFRDRLEEIEERFQSQLDRVEREVKRRLEEARVQFQAQLESELGKVREELEAKDRAQGAQLANAVSKLGGQIDETKRGLSQQGEKTDRAIAGLRREMEDQLAAMREEIERERELLAKQFETHRLEREDFKNQRRIDGVVDRYADEEILNKAKTSAEDGVTDIARLVLAGVRDLRSDLECIHAVGRIINRGGMAAADRDLLKRVMVVGMKPFFDALPYAERGEEPQRLTVEQVQELLARLEAARKRERDILEWLVPRPRELAAHGEPEPKQASAGG